ncbi:MAG: helix-turn-helix transcriptional regulator [Bauldia sp.]
MKPRFIRTDCGDELVLITRETYSRLLSFQHQIQTRQNAEWNDFEDRLNGGESVLRIYRRRAGLTQPELAKKSGLSQSYISAIEREKQMPTAKAIKALQRALGVDHLPLPDIRL